MGYNEYDFSIQKKGSSMLFKIIKLASLGRRLCSHFLYGVTCISRHTLKEPRFARHFISLASLGGKSPPFSLWYYMYKQIYTLSFVKPLVKSLLKSLVKSLIKSSIKMNNHKKKMVFFCKKGLPSVGEKKVNFQIEKKKRHLPAVILKFLSTTPNFT